MKLNENIMQLRKNRGMSQEKLAEQLEVSRQTISNWEQGQTMPNPDQLIILSKVFQKSIDELVGNEYAPKADRGDRNGILKGTVMIGAVVAGLWSFTANRFNYDEMLVIALLGGVIGLGMGFVLKALKPE